MNMWLLFALVSGMFYTAQGLLTRHILKGQKDAWAFSFYFSFIGALVSLPFVLLVPVLPIDLRVWSLGFLVSALILVQNFLNFRASNYIPAAISGALTKFRLVWVLVFSIAVGQVVFSPATLLGTILTIFAGLLIIRNFKHPKSLVGVWLAFGATIFYGIIIVLYKSLLGSFNAVSLSFFVTFMNTAVLNLIFMPRSIKRITSLFRASGKPVIAACACGAFANLAMNQGLSSGQASAVLVVIESFLVLTLVGEHIFLREREKLWIKILAVVLAVSGAVIIRLYS